MLLFTFFVFGSLTLQKTKIFNNPLKSSNWIYLTHILQERGMKDVFRLKSHLDTKYGISGTWKSQGKYVLDIFILWCSIFFNNPENWILLIIPWGFYIIEFIYIFHGTEGFRSMTSFQDLKVPSWSPQEATLKSISRIQNAQNRKRISIQVFLCFTVLCLCSIPLFLERRSLTGQGKHSNCVRLK